MTDGGRSDDGWREHLTETTERLPFAYFRELVLDVWRLRGFEVAHRYEGEGADFVAVRGPHQEPETEVVALSEDICVEDVRALAETTDDEARRVAVSYAFGPEASEEARRLGVETVDSAEIAGLVNQGGYYPTFYRWVALSNADEPDVTARGEAPLRYHEEGGKVVVGRSTAERVGVDENSVVRVAGEAAGLAAPGGRLERERDYVSVDTGYRDAVDADEGDKVAVELIDSEEARRVYVMSEPGMEEELATKVWQGYAPHTGTELRQQYSDGELWTMALEVLPKDYCYVSESTDVVVEGPAGARRVFE